MAAVNGVSGGQVGPAPGGVLLRDKTRVVMKAAGLISKTRSFKPDRILIRAINSVRAAPSALFRSGNWGDGRNDGG